MQQTGQAAARGIEQRRRAVAAPKPGGMERKRVETVVETLATLRGTGETLSEVAHDARNMVTALGLYCDLLEEPGVLAVPYMHYGHELRLVAAASRCLVEKIVALDAHAGLTAATPVTYPRGGGRGKGAAPEMEPHQVAGAPLDRAPGPDSGTGAERNRRWEMLPAVPIANLAAELLANRNLLAALAGPSIALTMDADGGARPVRLTGEDLTRVLVNLVKNAAEAMPGGGRIHIGLRERPAAQGAAACLALTIEDNGPGIPEGALDAIFTSGYTTHGKSEPGSGDWPLSHRGLGLAIARSVVEAAGGRVSAKNREPGGARFEIELPVRKAHA